MESYEACSTEELIRELVNSELVVDPGLAREISQRPDAVPHLVRIIEDDTSFMEGSPGDGWAPIHASFLLGAIKTPAARDAVFWLLRERDEELRDWITEDFPTILANFGLDAVEDLKKCISDRTLGLYQRSTAIGALSTIAHKHPEIWDSTVRFFRQLLQEEEDPELLGFLISDLSEFKDPEALEDIKSAFDKGLVDDFIITMEDVSVTYSSPDESMDYQRHSADPLEHFNPQKFERLWKISYENQRIPDRLKRMLKPEKIGRNDPCPCGSGKKYKKCCMKKNLGE
ncbi:TPA: DUF1186 domain-containing protein [Methanosarcinaceae archaeon]|nr:DUF1186 domain-containing protein [Methanosarcinaceae archaeon]